MTQSSLSNRSVKRCEPMRTLSTDTLSRVTKGKIGEWVARDYYHKQGYIVWHLESGEVGGSRWCSGTGKKYVSLANVTTPEEQDFLFSSRTFDLLVVPLKRYNAMRETLRDFAYVNSIKSALYRERCWLNYIQRRITESKRGSRYPSEIHNCIEYMEVAGIITPFTIEIIRFSSRTGWLKWLHEQEALLQKWAQRHERRLAKDFPRFRRALNRLDRTLVDVKSIWASPDSVYRSFKPTHPEDVPRAKKMGFKVKTLYLKTPWKEFKVKEESMVTNTVVA